MTVISWRDHIHCITSQMLQYQGSIMMITKLRILAKKRTSMTGMVLVLSGGAIGYKSKLQSIIAHSSTEAEFVAACDTAKMIL